MKRFALIRMINEWTKQECLMEVKRNTQAEAVDYFRQCYPSHSFDKDGYMKNGYETWCVAEFFS